MLDEKSLRKPGFTEGVRVTLADGQEWAFPQAYYRFFPARDESGKIIARGRVTYGPDRDDDLDVLFGGVEVDPLDRLDAMLRVAAELLLGNYDLADGDLARLLPSDARDERLRGMWEEVLGAIQGRSPKASPVGSE